MLISDRDVRALVAERRVISEPWDSTMVQPASIDVRLDRHFRLFNNHKYAMINPAKEQSGLTRLFDSEDKPLVPYPGKLVLGSTFEHVTLPNNTVTRLEGKPSLGCLGLPTHSTVGFIDPGFTGHIILKLLNTVTIPIVLYPKMKTRQLRFFQVFSLSEAPYGSGAKGPRYQG